MIPVGAVNSELEEINQTNTGKIVLRGIQQQQQSQQERLKRPNPAQTQI